MTFLVVSTSGRVAQLVEQGIEKTLFGQTTK
jgi:hypothetical protein